MARYQRIQASKKRRLDITFQNRKTVSASLECPASCSLPQKEQDQIDGTLDNISSLSHVHQVTKQIILVFEITSAPSTSTMTDVSMRDSFRQTVSY